MNVSCYYLHKFEKTLDDQVPVVPRLKTFDLDWNRLPRQTFYATISMGTEAVKLMLSASRIRAEFLNSGRWSVRKAPNNRVAVRLPR